MTIPGFQDVMLPLLRQAGDGAEHRISLLAESLAQEFGLTPEERDELLPSGRQPTFVNRVHWATTYLAKAGILERTGRGTVRMTSRGREVLASGVPKIDLAYLKRYPEIQEFRTRNQAKPTPPDENDDQAITPEEALDTNYQLLRSQLAQDLLDRLKQVSPQFFETVVIDLLLAMGYGGSRRDVVQAVGRSGDDGIDGIIKEDELGLNSVYVQAKRWDGTVSRPTIQAFAGSLEGQRARKGVFISTSAFTSEAKEYVNRIEKRIVLIDGQRLADLLIDHGVGVTTVKSYAVQRVDGDYFEAE